MQLVENQAAYLVADKLIADEFRPFQREIARLRENIERRLKVRHVKHASLLVVLAPIVEAWSLHQC